MLHKTYGSRKSQGNPLSHGHLACSRRLKDPIMLTAINALFPPPADLAASFVMDSDMFESTKNANGIELTGTPQFENEWNKTLGIVFTIPIQG